MLPTTVRSTAVEPQAEHGVLTPEEISRAEREVGLTASDTAA